MNLETDKKHLQKGRMTALMLTSSESCKNDVTGHITMATGYVIVAHSELEISYGTLRLYSQFRNFIYVVETHFFPTLRLHQQIIDRLRL